MLNFIHQKLNLIIFNFELLFHFLVFFYLISSDKIKTFVISKGVGRLGLLNKCWILYFFYSTFQN